MDALETINYAPVPVRRSLRREPLTAITSADGGLVVPLKAVHLLREDAVASGMVRVSVDMMETAETLLNPVQLTVEAWFIPWLADPRFDANLTEYNASYKKETVGGRALVPFFETMTFAKADPLMKTLGFHAAEGATVRADVRTAYNVLVNWRRKARSKNIAQRLMTTSTLAEGFWNTPRTALIVPDFDVAAMEGVVNLQLAAGKAPVEGIGFASGSVYNFGTRTVLETGSSEAVSRFTNAPTATDPSVVIAATNPGGIPEIYAELAEQGISVSLASIGQAKRTAAFARLRDTYEGVDDEHIVDMLMDGLRVPEASLAVPMKLGGGTTIFGYEKRWSTDADSLDKSVSNGRAVVEMRLRTPPLNSGGIILLTAEVVPQLLYERAKDPNLFVSDPDLFPSYVRDVLDTQPVEVVYNSDADVEHTVPDAVFGYAPLNNKWRQPKTNIGGKFYRAKADIWDEARQRFWAVEPTDPTLVDDYYLVKDLPKTVFADSLADSFEFVVTGELVISGLTVYGPVLHEDSDSYEEVQAMAPTDIVIP